MKLKDSIINLLTTTSLTNQEIATKLKCSYEFVRQLRNMLRPNSKPKLDLANYLQAILSGITTKQDLADYFGKDRMTIYRFEQKNNTKKKISKYMYISGLELEKIRQIFRLTPDEVENLKTLPTIKEIQADLKQISAVLHPLTSSSPDIAEKHANVNTLLREL